MSKSSIEWTQETWNPVAGCWPISPGCAHCYAKDMAARLEAMGQDKYAGLTRKTGGGILWTGRLNIHEPSMEIPLKRRKPTIYFVNSMSDLFHETLPWSIIDRIFAVMGLCGQHTFQVLTKRAEGMREYLSAPDLNDRLYKAFEIVAEQYDLGDWMFDEWPWRHVWLGVSVESQEWANARRVAFRETPTIVKFVSYEPALGQVDWTGWEFVRQIISGGESGRLARPSDPSWHRETRDFCVANSIAYLFKQWGNWAPREDVFNLGEGLTNRAHLPKTMAIRTVGGVEMVDCGKKAAGRLLDGRTWDEMPGSKEAVDA